MDDQDPGRASARPIPFTVNGRAVELTVSETVPLLDVLRNRLDLKGVRFGCGVEQCGSCMVLVDGKPEKSCGKPLWTIDGKAVTTVEGLGTRDRPHPLQVAFIEEQAGQCGYCLAGILISATALLNRNQSRSEIALALDGNLCRCGTHNRIIRAVQRAAAQLRREAPA